MRFTRTFLTLAAAAVLALGFAAAQAQSGSQTPDHIEEDWQLVVASPDTIGIGPQITTVMSATGSLSDPFVAFDMNYREYPSFTAGGMQVQVWSNNSVVSTASQGSNQFNTPNETVTWTQSMSLLGGGVYYAIKSGQSTTWGDFGQGSNLDVAYTSSIGDLSKYSPSKSVANSGASWESNRVTSLTLVQVRYYKNGVCYYTDTTQRPVSLGN